MTSKVEQDGDMYVFTCPHCEQWTEVPVGQVNCHIFRHAFFYQKMSGGGITLIGQIPPHSPKDVCDKLIEENRVVGCAKPFRFIRDENGQYRAEQCGYI